MDHIDDRKTYRVVLGTTSVDALVFWGSCQRALRIDAHESRESAGLIRLIDQGFFEGLHDSEVFQLRAGVDCAGLLLFGDWDAGLVYDLSGCVRDWTQGETWVCACRMVGDDLYYVANDPALASRVASTIGAVGAFSIVVSIPEAVSELDGGIGKDLLEAVVEKAFRSTADSAGRVRIQDGLAGLIGARPGSVVEVTELAEKVRDCPYEVLAELLRLLGRGEK